MKKPTRYRLTSSFKKWFSAKSLQTYTTKLKKLHRLGMLTVRKSPKLIKQPESQPKAKKAEAEPEAPQVAEAEA